MGQAPEELRTTDEQSRQITALMEFRFWWGDKDTSEREVNYTVQ